MRNIFDQYEQPENRLTHALISTLSNDRRLIRPFLKRLKIGPIPPVKGLRLVEQQVPGVTVSGDAIDGKGLPDACIFDDTGWALLLESKVQACVSRHQLERHLKTAARHGYDNAHVVVIAVNQACDGLPERARAVVWRDLYKWFRKFASDSTWARMFVDYMQVFESRMIAEKKLKKGTLTMFDGLRFDEDKYTAREGKRLIRLLRHELQGRRDLRELGVHPTACGRKAITGRGFDHVWDYLSLSQAGVALPRTAFPHLTLKLEAKSAVAAVTVPNAVKGGFRRKLEETRVEGFRSLVASLELALRPVVIRSDGAKPFIYVHQRHFKSRRLAIKDGRLDVDLRAMAGCADAGVKRQPEWIDAIYTLLTHKQCNIQFGVEVHFKYNCPIVQSPDVVDLFAGAWIALKPLLDFVLRDQ